MKEYGKTVCLKQLCENVDELTLRVNKITPDKVTDWVMNNFTDKTILIDGDSEIELTEDNKNLVLQNNTKDNLVLKVGNEVSKIIINTDDYEDAVKIDAEYLVSHNTIPSSEQYVDISITYESGKTEVIKFDTLVYDSNEESSFELLKYVNQLLDREDIISVKLS